jgi:hypothetical protein
MSEFASSLRTHLAFIARSCELYDRGHIEEALRMAVSLRVIFHDTRHSTSPVEAPQCPRSNIHNIYILFKRICGDPPWNYGMAYDHSVNDYI